MTAITRRSLVLGTMAVPFAQPALGQTATGNITRIVVPFPPGGTVDPIARMVQPGLQQRLNTIIVIENKPGASGSIGAAQVAKSPPDGSNWVFVFDTHAVNPFLQNLSFDTEKDLEPVLLIGTAPNVVATQPGHPFKTFADVIAAAKAKPDSVAYGSVGSGSLGHLTMVLLSQRAGVKMVHVPYRGSAPAVVDLIGGQIPLASVDLTSAYPHIQAGRLIALGLIDGKRFAAAPEIPTIAESGVPGFGRASGFIGLFAPAGTPTPIVKQLTREVAAILATPNAQAAARTLTAAIAYQDDEAFARFLAGESVNWKQALSSLDLRQ
jgi:tripartite-type tricarboxylate transporter receptor subunit TctC